MGAAGLALGVAGAGLPVSLLARPNVLLRRVTRHSWGPDPARVVVLAVVRSGESNVARIIGVDDGRAVEVERAEGVTIGPRARSVRLADGGEWPIVGVGCSCNVPGPLKGLDVARMP